MTTVSNESVAVVATAAVTNESSRDNRGSWIPNWAMIRTKILELRKRRGLMAALIVVNIGIPSIFLIVRLISHAVDPKSYGPAGGYAIFTDLVAGVMYVFGFIVAATLGCTAGSSDLTDGMFRHSVITGRSRLALYFARIPAGLAIVVPMVAAGFTIVCAVCVFAAPTTLNYQGINIPPGLTATGFNHWAEDHTSDVLCGFPYNGPIGFPCSVNGKGEVHIQKLPPGIKRLTHAQVEKDALKVAEQNYPAYARTFLYPSIPLMVRTGLWIELEAAIGLIVGLGLASLMGQRTVPVVLMIILEVVLTPLFARTAIRHLINVQRGLVGLATDHLEPGGLPHGFGGGGPNGVQQIVPESRTVAICVIVSWLVVWTALGAWRMVKRDA